MPRPMEMFWKRDRDLGGRWVVILRVVQRERRRTGEVSGQCTRIWERRF